MAEKRLKLTFENSAVADKEVSISIPRCDDTKSGIVVKAAMDAIYDNREVFALDIGAVKKAEFVIPTQYLPITLV